MAERLHYQVPEPDPRDKLRRDAYAELDALVISLHQHDVLRLLRDLSGSLAELGLIATREVNNPQGYNALANLYLLAGLLGRLPSADFKRILNALGDGVETLGRAGTPDTYDPPGLLGAYKLLKDDELWDALAPILEGVKAFSRELRRDGENKPPQP